MNPPPTDWLRYPRLFVTFARNSLIRDMTFRANFIIEAVSSMTWMLMNLGFYEIIYGKTDSVAGWSKPEFWVFIATTMFVNSLVQTFFMPNAQELSELVRTGGLDFALLKPIDPQFLLSMRKMGWSSLGNFVLAAVLLVIALPQIDGLQLTVVQVVLYPLYVVCGVAILYSVMISLAATSIWLGRNQSLYDFWFYITNFSRYPMEIYYDPSQSNGNSTTGNNIVGRSLWTVFTFVVPVLVVINVPARMLAKPLSWEYGYLAMFAIVATAMSLLAGRWIFTRALASYRSASS